MRPSICFEHGTEHFPERLRGVSPACYLRARSGHVLPGVGVRPKFCPFIFHELKRMQKTFTFWLIVRSSPDESYVFLCQISCFSNYFRFSKRNFSSFFDPLWMAQHARGTSLVSLRQSSLVPSLYGQIAGLTQPAWLTAPPSSVFPVVFPCPCRFSSPVCVHGLSPVHNRSRMSALRLVLGVLLLGAAPLGMGRSRRWGRDPEPMGRESRAASALQDGRRQWGRTLCLRGVGDTENRLRYSPQLVPIINPAVSVVSQNITWGVRAHSGCRVKKR